MVWHPPHTYAHLTLEQAPRVDRPPQTLCCASHAPCLLLRGSVMPHEALLVQLHLFTALWRLFVRQRHQRPDRVAVQSKRSSANQPGTCRSCFLGTGLCTWTIHGQPAHRTSSGFQVGLRSEDFHRCKRRDQCTGVRTRQRGCGLFGAPPEQRRLLATSASVPSPEPGHGHTQGRQRRLGVLGCYPMRHNRPLHPTAFGAG